MCFSKESTTYILFLQYIWYFKRQNSLMYVQYWKKLLWDVLSIWPWYLVLILFVFYRNLRHHCVVEWFKFWEFLISFLGMQWEVDWCCCSGEGCSIPQSSLHQNGLACRTYIYTPILNFSSEMESGNISLPLIACQERK